MKFPIPSTRRRRWAAVLLATLALALRPSNALAHSGEPAAIAPALAWGFMGFGALVIVGVALVLFTGRQEASASGETFARLTGFSGYIGKMRLFSRNARLYMVHVVGMDVIYGTWAVLFNLYLLAIGFDIAFIGLRILVGAVASALASIPAGLISDRIGRKLSFILGDGMGALMSLIAISTTNEALLLVTAGIGGLFGALHGVAEPAFMAENSREYERVHLFSVSGGTRTAAAIIGSALAGLVPLIFSASGGGDVVGLYRMVAYFGIGGWFASLIPAVMLQQVAAPEADSASGSKGLFANIKNPGLIWRLTAPEVLIGLGAGFALPLMNVFFRAGVDSHEVEIGAVFAAGEAFLVVGSFLAPLLAARLGKVRSVVLTRSMAIPFILVLALSPDLGSETISVLSIAGLAYIGRITLQNMASPVRSAFAMELLDEKERGTQVGIQQAFAVAFSGLASFAGASLMDAGNFQLPFYLMAVCYAVAVVLFWRFFGGARQEMAARAAAS